MVLILFTNEKIYILLLIFNFNKYFTYSDRMLKYISHKIAQIN